MGEDAGPVVLVAAAVPYKRLEMSSARVVLVKVDGQGIPIILLTNAAKAEEAIPVGLILRLLMLGLLAKHFSQLFVFF